VSYTPAPHHGALTLSLHDALPISGPDRPLHAEGPRYGIRLSGAAVVGPEGRALLRAAAPRGASNRRESIASSWVRIVSGATVRRSEEHTSELQSRFDLVCRLLLEK